MSTKPKPPEPTDEEQLAEVDALIETGKDDPGVSLSDFDELFARRDVIQKRINANKPPSAPPAVPAAAPTPPPTPTPEPPPAPETTVERINREHRERYGDASPGRIGAPRASSESVQQIVDRAHEKRGETRPKGQNNPGRIA